MRGTKSHQRQPPIPDRYCPPRWVRVTARIAVVPNAPGVIGIRIAQLPRAKRWYFEPGDRGAAQALHR